MCYLVFCGFLYAVDYQDVDRAFSRVVVSQRKRQKRCHGDEERRLPEMIEDLVEHG